MNLNKPNSLGQWTINIVGAGLLAVILWLVYARDQPITLVKPQVKETLVKTRQPSATANANILSQAALSRDTPPLASIEWAKCLELIDQKKGLELRQFYYKLVKSQKSGQFYRGFKLDIFLVELVKAIQNEGRQPTCSELQGVLEFFIKSYIIMVDQAKDTAHVKPASIPDQWDGVYILRFGRDLQAQLEELQRAHHGPDILNTFGNIVSGDSTESRGEELKFDELARLLKSRENDALFLTFRTEGTILIRSTN